jgi:hypothetical protein
LQNADQFRVLAFEQIRIAGDNAQQRITVFDMIEVASSNPIGINL